MQRLIFGLLGVSWFDLLIHAFIVQAELLKTLEPDPHIQPLFPGKKDGGKCDSLGKSCFPLSSKQNEKTQNERFGEEFRAETHQLVKIFEVIGTPPREELLKLDDSPMKEVECLNECLMNSIYCHQSIFHPKISVRCIHMLKKLLLIY